MIRFQDVALRYDPTSRPALQGLSFEIEKGESVALVGPSGSGKTSILRLMNALLIPSEGRVSIDGLDTSVDSNVWEVRRRAGLIFQNPDNQLVSTTVERELAFGLENLGLPQREIAERVEDALRRFRLERLRKRAPHKLSGGEKQRVAIAAVVSMNPDCLLLDEPTSLLDAAGRTEVMSILDELASDRDRTVVHVTQFPNEIWHSSRVLVIVGGGLVFDGAPAELFAREDDMRGWQLRRPVSMEIASTLRDAGYNIPSDATGLEEVAGAIASGRSGGDD